MFRPAKRDDSQLALFKRCFETDMKEYIKKASLFQDNHALRATAVNSAVQKARTTEDVLAILNNQLDLLKGKEPSERITHLLEERYSTQLKGKSKLNALSSPMVQLWSNAPEPSTYHDYIQKHYYLIKEMGENLTKTFNFLGQR